MKTLRNFVVTGGLRRSDGSEAQVGDSVRLYPYEGEPFIGVIKSPISPFNCGQDRSYVIEYDLEEVIRPCDLQDMGDVLDCCSLLGVEVEQIAESLEAVETNVELLNTEVAKLSVLQLPVPAIVNTGAFPTSSLEPASSGMSFNPPTGKSGKIQSIEFNAVGTGGFEFHKIRRMSDNTWATASKVSYTAATTGSVILLAGRDFPEWELDSNETIGIYANGGTYAYSNASNGLGFYYINSGNTNPLNTAVFSPNSSIPLKLVVESSVPVNLGDSFIEYSPEFEFLPKGWYAGVSPWSFNPTTGIASSGAAGIQNGLVSEALTNIDNRRIEITFSIDSNTTTALFYSLPQEGINSGSMVRVNANNNKLEILSRYNADSIEGSVLSSVDLGITIQTNKKYLLVWEKDGRSFTVSLRQLDNSVIATLTRKAIPDGWISYPSTFGYDQGSLQGRISVAAGLGSVKAYTVRHFSKSVANPWLYILGDSITEGFTVTDAQKWSSKIQDLIGDQNVVISGIGSAEPSSGLNRMKLETQSLKPRNVLIYLGTNTDNSFAANILALVTYCRNIGANVYVATIPTNVGYTTIINALPNYVKKIPFAQALTLGGAGVTIDPQYYVNTDSTGASYNDGIHPNALGHQKMADTVQSSATELFYPIGN